MPAARAESSRVSPAASLKRRAPSPLPHRAEHLRLAPVAEADSRSPRSSRNTKADARHLATGKPPAKAPKTLRSPLERWRGSLDSSMSRLGRQGFEDYGVRPVDKALRHGGSALGVGQLPGVFCHVYAFKHLAPLKAILVS